MQKGQSIVFNSLCRVSEPFVALLGEQRSDIPLHCSRGIAQLSVIASHEPALDVALDAKDLRG